MVMEIERKFLINKEKLPKLKDGKKLTQGYLSFHNPSIRIRMAEDEAFLTIKGSSHDGGISRSEFEYPVPLQDAKELLKECKSLLIIKTRYEIEHHGHIWELDIFEDDNRGLIIAEIELENANESFVLPSWVTTEVSTDTRYTNATLAQKPFKEW
jgi:adenylate cyclase